MKNIKLFENFDVINEGVSTKDWDRMLPLVMKDDDGSTVAKLIKDKNKAMARFVAGLKLGNDPLNYNDRWKEYSGPFSELGNTAIKLGATPEEIEALFNATDVPQSYVEKMTKLAGKKLNNRFVGDISRAFIDAGCDIEYQPHNGNAITREGMDAMSRNGRKWTIGYKSVVTINGKKFDFNFDAITDEGDGPTYYVVHHSSSSVFAAGFDRVGKVEFIKRIKKIVADEKN